MFKLILAMLLVALLAACSGNHCLSVSGEYSGIEGSVEYCYSPKATQSNKIATFDSVKGEHYLISNDELTQAIQKLESPANSVKPSSLPKNTASKTVVDRFRELIR